MNRTAASSSIVTRLRRATAAMVVVLTLLAVAPAQASWRASADSLFAEADARYASGDYGESAVLYDRTIETIESHAMPSPGTYFDRLAAHALFLVARSHERLDDWEVAIEHYRMCLDVLPEIEDVLRLRMASCHADLEDHASAIDELRRVVDDDVDGQFDLEATYRLGLYFEEMDDPDMALQWYTMYLGAAGSYDERALAHYRIGRAYERRGDEDAAKRSYATAVNDYPRSRHAYDAMQRARGISRDFTDRYHQGLVLYNRKQYSRSAEFFTWYVRHDKEQQHAHEANYFLGRSHQRLGNFQTAARRFEDAAEFGPEAEYFDLAWSKLAYCRRASGRLELSLETYDEYASAYPNREAAADILWEKARLLEEKRRWEEAGEEFSRLAGAFPESDRAADALFRSGLCLFKRDDVDGAAAVFAVSHLAPDEEDASRALFWSGKCREALGAVDEAAAAYAQAAETSPDTYYGTRARARLRELGIGFSSFHGEAVNGTRGLDGSPARGRAAIWDAEALGFASWLAEWHEEVYLPAGRAALRRELESQLAFRRADVFLALHMRDEALNELSDLADEVGSDPRMLHILVDYCERSGLHKRGILFAERIMSMSPSDGIAGLPVALQKRICPDHFREIVVRECAGRGLDANVKFSLIRQESLFEPRAVSWVGARGLSQIMPATGWEVARRLGVRGHRTSNLFDPETNVRFGTEYLAAQLERFDGEIMRALAAYNGGPEASERWWGYGGGRDVDVFVEDIGYSQTAEYVRRVFLYSEFYRDLYGTAP